MTNSVIDLTLSWCPARASRQKSIIYNIGYDVNGSACWRYANKEMPHTSSMRLAARHNALTMWQKAIGPEQTLNQSINQSIYPNKDHIVCPRQNCWAICEKLIHDNYLIKSEVLMFDLWGTTPVLKSMPIKGCMPTQCQALIFKPVNFSASFGTDSSVLRGFNEHSGSHVGQGIIRHQSNDE